MTGLDPILAAAEMPSLGSLAARANDAASRVQPQQPRQPSVGPTAMSLAIGALASTTGGVPDGPASAGDGNTTTKESTSEELATPAAAAPALDLAAAASNASTAAPSIDLDAASTAGIVAAVGEHEAKKLNNTFDDSSATLEPPSTKQAVVVSGNSSEVSPQKPPVEPDAVVEHINSAAVSKLKGEANEEAAKQVTASAKSVKDAAAKDDEVKKERDGVKKHLKSEITKASTDGVAERNQAVAAATAARTGIEAVASKTLDGLDAKSVQAAEALEVQSTQKVKQEVSAAQQARDQVAHEQIASIVKAEEGLAEKSSQNLESGEALKKELEAYTERKKNEVSKDGLQKMDMLDSQFEEKAADIELTEKKATGRVRDDEDLTMRKADAWTDAEKKKQAEQPEKKAVSKADGITKGKLANIASALHDNERRTDAARSRLIADDAAQKQQILHKIDEDRELEEKKARERAREMRRQADESEAAAIQAIEKQAELKRAAIEKVQDDKLVADETALEKRMELGMQMLQKEEQDVLQEKETVQNDEVAKREKVQTHIDQVAAGAKETIQAKADAKVMAIEKAADASKELYERALHKRLEAVDANTRSQEDQASKAQRSSDEKTEDQVGIMQKRLMGEEKKELQKIDSATESEQNNILTSLTGSLVSNEKAATKQVVATLEKTSHERAVVDASKQASLAKVDLLAQEKENTAISEEQAKKDALQRQSEQLEDAVFEKREAQAKKEATDCEKQRSDSLKAFEHLAEEVVKNSSHDAAEAAQGKPVAQVKADAQESGAPALEDFQRLATMGNDSNASIAAKSLLGGDVGTRTVPCPCASPSAAALEARMTKAGSDAAHDATHAAAKRHTMSKGHTACPCADKGHAVKAPEQKDRTPHAASSQNPVSATLGAMKHSVSSLMSMVL
eukprot:TRINITY_DN81404_c0_g1_i1.p1 TRINITY_DN81404_c0_g1~~TRINITY_DN81404_c0_g1_i1.p1  ORF type:complete len:995 (-),score=300.68 TRINITY_DN81404_c0_g1_i1:105-2846(-)